MYSSCQICLDNKKYIRADEISPWTLRIIDIRTMQQGFYPYRKNDLELEEWKDLGTANETIKDIKQQAIIAALIPKSQGF